MWENGVNIHDVKMIRTRVNLFFGAGAIKSFSEIAKAMRAKGIDSVMAVTGKSAYRRCGAWEVITAALDAEKIKYCLFDEVTPNPTTIQVDKAASLGKANHVQAVIGIGGGSAIDAAKSAAVLLSEPGLTAAKLYSGFFEITKALPVIAVNLTHGTGSETNRFAVVSIPETEQKPAIAADAIYPWFAIDDPELMRTLSPNQTRFVSIDAVNHVIETATAASTNPLAIMLARDTIAMVAEHLPSAIKDPADLNARYWLLYASMLGGFAFDNGGLHITHALEHSLSGMKPELTHGLGLAVLLPAVVEAIYPAAPAVMADILAPFGEFSDSPQDGKKAGELVYQWLKSCGVPEKLEDVGFTTGDIPKLVKTTLATPSLAGMLSLSPIKMTPAAITAIYQNSFRNR